MVEVALTKNLSSIDLQIHFYFKDPLKHSMEAVSLNECERQFIKAIRNIDKSFEIEIHAKKEGGLIEHIEIITNNPSITVLVAAIATGFFTARFKPKLSIEEQSKYKTETIQSLLQLKDVDKLTSDVFDYIAHNDKNLKKLKSNFFSSAKKDSSLVQVEVDTTTEINNKPIFNSLVIPYNEFDDFILVDDQEDKKLSPGEDPNAKIFIIAPVLVKGVLTHWMGYYGGFPIDFTVTDKDFLDDIYLRETKFGSGTYIDCTLVSTTVIKAGTGRETVVREVTHVENVGDDKGFKKPIKHKTVNRGVEQGSLFDEDEGMQ